MLPFSEIKSLNLWVLVIALRRSSQLHNRYKNSCGNKKGSIPHLVILFFSVWSASSSAAGAYNTCRLVNALIDLRGSLMSFSTNTLADVWHSKFPLQCSYHLSITFSLIILLSTRKHLLIFSYLSGTNSVLWSLAHSVKASRPCLISSYVRYPFLIKTSAVWMSLMFAYVSLAFTN